MKYDRSGAKYTLELKDERGTIIETWTIDPSFGDITAQLPCTKKYLDVIYEDLAKD